MILPISATASMLMPAFVVATFTEEQTLSVMARASGMDSTGAYLPWCSPYVPVLRNRDEVYTHIFAASSRALAKRV
jgi:hypothetical protein